MSKSYIEYTDDIPTGDRIINIRLSKADMALANYSRFDRALLDDIENGEPSNTPMADKLLGLEIMVRRIEEATNQSNKDESL